jgi:hypothetical protein
VWQQNHNAFTDQDPAFLDHVINKKADSVRLYLLPDTFAPQGVARLRSTPEISADALAGATDCNIAMDILDVIGLSRNGHGFVRRSLSASGAGQPYDAIPVGVDMNALQAGYMICSQFGLDLGCNGGILHIDHCV